jgi:hypothetical protein
VAALDLGFASLRGAIVFGARPACAR